MSKDRLSQLMNGNIRFISYMSSTELDRLFLKIKSSPLKEKILDGCFFKLKEKYPMYAFLLVYGIDEYKDFCIQYLNNDFSFLFNESFLISFISSNNWGISYVIDNLEQLIYSNKNIVYLLVKYSLSLKDEESLKKLLYCEDLSIRGQAMINLLCIFPELFSRYYDNVTDYLILHNFNEEEYMPEEFVSKIACLLLKNGFDIVNYDNIKSFLLKNYISNSLALELDKMMMEGPHWGDFERCIEVLKRDINELFLSSKNYKFELYKKYSFLLNREVLNDFKVQLQIFEQIDSDIIEHIFMVGLGDKFLEFVNNYMKISTGAKLVTNLGKGSCSRAFLVGDYVIKCSFRKWTSARCPDLFLVAKNYEDEIVLDNEGNVVGEIEVQKFLKKPFIPSEATVDLVDKFYLEFEKNGYRYRDCFLGKDKSPNVFYLDSYRDADCANPLELPEWFKKDPIVLVDRDLVYKKVK